MTRRLHRAEGLTLIEFTLALAVSSVVFMVLYSVLNAAVDSYRLGQLRSHAVQTGRVALARFVNEVRVADEVYVFTDAHLLIRKELENLAVDGSGTDYQVEYQYDGTSDQLERRERQVGAGTWGSWEIIADGVSSFSLTYWDRNLAPMALAATDPTQIGWVEVEMALTDQEYTIHLRDLILLDNPVVSR